MKWHINKKKTQMDISRSDVERQLATALRQGGAFVPESEEEIAAASQYEATVLPQHLRDSEAVLKQIESGKRVRVFGCVVKQLRISMKATVNDLAKASQIQAEEVEMIEADDGYVPKPRTVSQLAEYFGIAKPAFIQLAGLAKQSDPRLTEGAVRFAACSTNMNIGDREQQRAVREFVRILNKIN